MSRERDDQYDAVDALIDEAARSLTQAEAPVSLRARVRSSIDRAPRRRPWAWQPALASAAAVIIAAVVLWQLPRTTAPSPPSVPQHVERALALPRTQPQQTVRAGVAGPPIERVARRGSEATQATGVVVRGPVTPAVDPLPAIEPIAFEPVESSAIAAIERMPAPMPVDIERLAIEPLFE